MDTPRYERALIVGAGEGLSASLARLFAKETMRVALAARQTNKLAGLCREIGARAPATLFEEPCAENNNNLSSFVHSPVATKADF